MAQLGLNILNTSMKIDIICGQELLKQVQKENEFDLLKLIEMKESRLKMRQNGDNEFQIEKI